MASTKDYLVIDDLRSGRNDTDPPLSLPETQCVEALNVDWSEGRVAHKRNGSTAVTDTGGTAFSSGIFFLERFVPGASDAAAEFWGIDGAGLVKRMAGGTSFADVTLSDAISGNHRRIYGATLNGKLYLAYDSAVDRLHAYDPSLASPRVRRVGFATPAAPTAANTGAGAYAATLRYYRVRWLQLDGTRVVRRSEPGASVSFTPSGTGTAARVTQPAVAGEQETHWEVEASTDNTTFYRLSQVAIATTTYDDSAVVTTYANNTLSDPTGFYSNWSSVQAILTDGNRLLGAGGWESGAKTSRVYFSPVLGSADKGDDERVPNQTTQKNWIDVNENDGGGVIGLMGPLNGVILAAKYRSLWKLIPTGDANAPYLPRKISDHIGLIHMHAWAMGYDEAGRPCVYFYASPGPYRYGARGLQYLGRDNEATWSTVNQGANLPAWVMSHPDKHQTWFSVSVDAENEPASCLVFDWHLGRVAEGDQVRGGWSRWTGAGGPAARCGVLMSNTLGATMSSDLKPYVGLSTGTTIRKRDTTATDDAGTNFQAYVDTKPFRAHPGTKMGMGAPTLTAEAASGVTITVSAIRDYGLETRTSTALLTASASETRVVKKCEAGDGAGADVLTFRIGDSAAASNGWTLDELVVPVIVQEQR